MAAKSQFWAEKVTRKYKGVPREVWRACWIDQTGTERTKDNRNWRKVDAEQYAADMAALIRGGVFVADRDSATVADAIKLKMHECEERNRPPRYKMSGNNLAHWKWATSKHLLPEFGKLKLSAVKPKLVETWARRLVAHGMVNSDTANVLVNKLKLVLDVAADETQGWLPRNPLRGVKLKLPEEMNSEREVPQDQDVVAALDAMAFRPFCQPEVLFRSLRMLVFLTAFGGLRPNEACGLQWEDINWDKWELNVRHGLTRKEGLTDLPKTRSGIRDVDIMPILYAELEDHRARIQNLEPRRGCWKSRGAIMNARSLTGHVVLNGEANRLLPAAASYLWRDIKKRAGLPNAPGQFTLHTLRHYAGSVWIRDGVPLHKVSRMLGHSNTAFTERRYIHVIKELDATRLHDMKRVSDGLAARYHRLGLTVPATPLPANLIAIEHPRPVSTANVTLPAVVDMPPAPEPAQHVPAIRTIADLRAAQRAEAVDLWSQGMGPDDIARKLKVGSAAVRRWIDERDVTIVHGGRWEVDEETRAARKAKARELAENGLSYREISRQIGVRIGALRTWAVDDGWKVVSPNRSGAYRAARRAKN